MIDCMEEKVKTVERYHAFVLLMLSGGFMGSYSYFLKGGVFANAETANLVIFGLSLAELDFERALSVLIPISTFFFGTVISQAFIEKLKERWHPVLLFFEIILLAVLAFLPEDTPFVFFHVAIALISSMQFNTFRQARGVAMSTLFCTAHLRGCGSQLYSAIANKDMKALKKSGYHAGLIGTFVLGAILSSAVSGILGTHSIALAAIPLIAVLFEDLLSK